MLFKQLSSFLNNPRQLLLIDAIGALITSVMTAFILAPGWIQTGLPTSALIVLAAVASVFFAISYKGYLGCSQPKPLLRRMAGLNSAYCMATAALCFAFLPVLTIWGWLYFPAEILVVLTLVAWELKVSGLFGN